jgi:uncharacterized protein (TIGR00255 family)
MTGFSRGQGHDDSFSWTWEIKSVNAKGLDVRARLPSGFENLEQPARERIAKRFNRGAFNLGLSIRNVLAAGTFQVNREALDQVLSLLPDIRERFPDAGPPSIDGLLSLRGVVESVEEELSEDARQALETGILASLETVLDALAAMRGQEGARLAPVLDAHLDAIARLCAEAEDLAATQPEALRQRLRTQVTELLEAAPALSEDRLAQEAALLAAKADVREELDRLAAHHTAVRALLGRDGAVGRKLDFLCQELNREANTLCAKSADVALTRVGLDLKAAIEQLREQVQNIE